jgi:hypothetical protein
MRKTKAVMEIEALGRKLRILADEAFGGSWNDLAESFERRRSTVYGWTNNVTADGFAAMPDDSFAVLLILLQKHLPQIQNEIEAEQLALGHVQAFEQAFYKQGEQFWNQIIEAEAIRNSGKAVPKPDLKKEGTGLVQSDKNVKKPNPQQSVPIDQWFRIEFSGKFKTGHVFCLQQAGLNWGGLTAELKPKSNTICVPGFHEDGTDAHICERDQTGVHKFILIQTPAPPPLEFMRYIEDRIELDGTILRLLAGFYTSQPKSQRGLHVFEVEVTAE